MAASTTAAAAAAAAAPGNLDALSVKFTHTNTVRDKKPYTVSFRGCWVLWLLATSDAS
jgi:hypothetical protein